MVKYTESNLIQKDQRRVFGVLDTTYLCFFRSVEEAKVQYTVSAIFPVNEKLVKYSTSTETVYFTKISTSP